MRILLFGGTFDPPHMGHINNLKAARTAVQPDKTIVMPAGVPPHKAASATPAELRFQMCRCFCQLQDTHGPVTVSRWEMEQASMGRQNYSVKTLEMLAQRYPGAELYMTVGSDMLLEFTGWFEWKKILGLCTLVVQSRQPGDEQQLKKAAEFLEQQGGKICFASAPALPLASSDIRSGVAGNEALPPLVRKIVEEYHLYGR